MDSLCHSFIHLLLWAHVWIIVHVFKNMSVRWINSLRGQQRSTGSSSSPASCYADSQRNDIRTFSQHGGPMPETVAKQFLHLSNHPTVTARDGPAEEGEEGRKDEADSRQRAVRLLWLALKRLEIRQMWWGKSQNVDGEKVQAAYAVTTICLISVWWWG